MSTPMTAHLRDGREVEVAERHTQFSRTWRRQVTAYLRTIDGELIMGWQVERLDPEPQPDRAA
jgi:hypothetical protein